MSTKHSKYEIRRSRKLSRRQIYGIAATAVIVVSLLAVYSFYTLPDDEFSAVLVDQLSQTWSNATFPSDVNGTLRAAGYSLTYNNASEITVDYYRDLPLHGYKIVILRVHAALRFNETTGAPGSPLDLFTSEPYSNEVHIDDLAAQRLDIVMYHADDKEQYFGIPSRFITGSMRGSFQDAVIILMGCNGLDGRGFSRELVQALVDKGAKAVIGWNATVSASHTDIATEKLLHHLLIENRTIKDAIKITNDEMGTQDKNKLVYYPVLPWGYPYYSLTDVGNYTIPHGPLKTATAAGITASGAFLYGAAAVSALPLQSTSVLRVFRRLRKQISSVFPGASRRLSTSRRVNRCLKASSAAVS